jgi:hypothetical protein
MAVNEKSAGPRVGQPVLYNNNGVFQAAIITAVNAATGTVTLVTFPPGAAATTPAGILFSPSAQVAGTWGYPDFF